MRTYLVWCDYSQDGSLKMGSLRAVAIARSQLGYELQENDLRGDGSGACVLFFFLFASLFTASLMVSSCFGRAGEQVVRWFVGSAVRRQSCRLETDGNHREGVVKTSCVSCVSSVYRRRWVPLSQVQVNAARKGKTG